MPHIAECRIRQFKGGFESPDVLLLLGGFIYMKGLWKYLILYELKRFLMHCIAI